MHCFYFSLDTFLSCLIMLTPCSTLSCCRRRRRSRTPMKWRRLISRSSLMSLTFVDLYSELSRPYGTTGRRQSRQLRYL